MAQTLYSAVYIQNRALALSPNDRRGAARFLGAMGACWRRKQYAGLTAEEAWQKATAEDMRWYLSRVIPEWNEDRSVNLAYARMKRDLHRIDLIVRATYPPTRRRARAKLEAELIRAFYNYTGVRRINVASVEFTSL